MLFLVENSLLIQNRARTFLTATVAATGTTLTVRNVNTNEWADNDWIIVGAIGTPNAEVLQINGATVNGTSLTIDNAGAGGARYAHAVDEPVYNIPYNQVKFYRAVTADGSKTLLSTVTLMPDSEQTRYEDQTNTSGYGFVAFFNSFTSGISPFSDAIPYSGQSSTSLTRLITKVRTLLNNPNTEFLTDQDVTDAINDKQRDILNERLWTFNETSYSTPYIQYQFQYDMPPGIKTLHTVRYQTQPLARVGQARFEMLNWDTQTQASPPTNVTIFQGSVRVWPRPDASANTTQLNGAISDTATSIIVDDGGSFMVGDFYRFLIDSEIIYATFYDSDLTTFTGCIRGQEGTTPASHLDNAVVTEQGLVFTGQAEPVDLAAQNDETIVPEALVVCYGAAADLAYAKIQDDNLGDRYEKRYEEAIESLRNKYTLKLTSQFGRVKDPREVIRDNGWILSPNDFPQNIIAPPPP